MTCTFFGHRDTPPSVQPVLRSVLLELIERHGVRQFYVGHQGSFDAMACRLLDELSRTHGVRYAVVLSRLPQTDELPDHVPTLFPDGMESVPLRFAIDRRNRWMLSHSDIVVTHVHCPVGGAAKFKALAVRQKKTVVELTDRFV